MLNLFKSSRHLICLALTTLGYTPWAFAVDICNRTPYAVDITYSFVQPKNNEYETIGWYPRKPGECIQLQPSVGNVYWYHAHADSSDIVAKHLKEADAAWGSSKDPKKTSRLCVTSDAFHHFSSTKKNGCNQKNSRYENFRLLENEGQKDYTLSLTSTGAGKSGIKILTNEDAAGAHRALKGQILYKRNTSDDPTSTPYRAGLDLLSDEYGVFVSYVHPGLPADGVLKPGDRIIAIDNSLIKTPYDVIFKIQEIGYHSVAHERISKSKFTIYRWESLDAPPIKFQTHVDLAYYRELDDRINPSMEGEAAIRSLADSVLFGFSPGIFCTAKRIKQSLIDEKPSHQLDHGCSRRLKDEREELIEQYESTYQVFDFVGSAFSPRLVLKTMAKSALKKRATRVAVGMIDEAVQGGLTVVGQLAPEEQLQPPAILRGSLLGAAVGGGTAVVLGR